MKVLNQHGSDFIKEAYKDQFNYNNNDHQMKTMKEKNQSIKILDGKKEVQNMNRDFSRMKQILYNHEGQKVLKTS